MLKINKFVTASAEQMEMVIEGMRNPKESWERSDSKFCNEYCGCHKEDSCDNCPNCYDLGTQDLTLMNTLANAGTDHRKFLRMMPVLVSITAPLYWWKEFDTYKVGTVSNSCSTMHKIADKEFTLEDFSCEHLFDDEFDSDHIFRLLDNNLSNTGIMFTPLDLMQLTCNVLNFYRKKFLETSDKNYWRQMIQLLPSSYNQTRMIFLNYEVLANIYKSRRNHKLDEWRAFCEWADGLPYFKEIMKKTEYKVGLESQAKKFTEKVKSLQMEMYKEMYKALGIVSPSETSVDFSNKKMNIPEEDRRKHVVENTDEEETLVENMKIEHELLSPHISGCSNCDV